MQEVSVQNEGATLVFQVNTRNEDRTSVSVVESDTEIVVTASTCSSLGCSGGDDCSDPRSVQLEEPRCSFSTGPSPTGASFDCSC